MERLGEANEGRQAQRDAVEHIVIGFEACAAALEFTADHGHLVPPVRAMKPVPETLRADHPDDHRAVVATLSEVCESMRIHNLG